MMEKLFIEEQEINLLKELGEGSYGKVYAGECRKKPVAVKVVGDKKLSELSKKKFKELEQEMLIMTENLQHENIILAMGISTVEEKLAIVMELLDGDLDGLLIKNKNKAKTMSIYQRLSMARDAALGMNWLHSREPAIIHRDLKLENLMYKKTAENSYVIKIADFGLAVVKPKKKKSLRGEALGTPVTMAPEIMQEKPFTQKADVYSFGLCLWQMVTLERLFPNAKPEKFIKAICVKGERPPIPDWLIKASPELVDLIQCCWDADPQVRPSFHDIIMQLDNILVDVAISDINGRLFWKSLEEKRQDIPWPEFWESLREFLGIPTDNDIAQTCFLALLRDCHKNKKMEVVNIETFGNFLRWYGPLDPQNEGNRTEEHKACTIEGDRRTSRSMAHRLEALLRAPWFHGLLDNDEAMSKLEGKEANTFLVRCSSTPGLFAVTRTINNKGRTQASRLTQSEKGFTVEGGNSDSMQCFDTLNQLIETLVTRLNWTTCSGSPFSLLFADKADSGLDPYVSLLT